MKRVISGILALAAFSAPWKAALADGSALKELIDAARTETPNVPAPHSAAAGDSGSSVDALEQSRKKWERQIESLQEMLSKTQDASLKVEIAKLLDSAQKSLDEINAAIEKQGQQNAKMDPAQEEAFAKAVKLAGVLKQLILLTIEPNPNGYYATITLPTKRTATLDIAGIEGEYKALTDRVPLLRGSSSVSGDMAYVHLVGGGEFWENADILYGVLQPEFQAALLKALRVKNSDPGLDDLAAWGMVTRVKRVNEGVIESRLPVINEDLHARFGEARKVARSQEEAKRSKVASQWAPPADPDLKWIALDGHEMEYHSAAGASNAAEGNRTWFSNAYAQ